MKRFTFILLAATLILACGDDSNSEAKANLYKNLDIVTGMALTDELGAPIGLWRSPNDKRDGLSIFPNPSKGVFGLSFQNVEPKQFWIVPANCASDSDIIVGDIDFSFEKDQITNLALRNGFVPSNGIIINMNLTDLKDGFYKIFFELSNGDIRWQNVYISPELNHLNYLDQLNAACL